MDKNEYIDLMQNSNIRDTYNQIVKKMNTMRNSLNRDPDFTVTALTQSQLDYSYFYLVTDRLRKHKCRYCVIFDHSTFYLQAWLVAQNKKVNEKLKPKFSHYPQNDLALKIVNIDDDFLETHVALVMARIIHSQFATEDELEGERYD